MIQIRPRKESSATESSRAGMAKHRTISLKMVAPVIPRGAKEKAILEEDLKRMGCYGLMLQPWSIKYEKIVQELLQKQGNQWARSIPDLWTAAVLRKVYGFPI